MRKLYGDCNELENQSIYFATPYELNDPTEGVRTLFWQGDRIVWTNLFRHYLYCLNRICFLLQVVGDSGRIQRKHIPIDHDMDYPDTEKATRLFDDICRVVFDVTSIHDFSLCLEHTERRIDRNELLLYLTMFHVPALDGILGRYVHHGYMNASEHTPVSAGFSQAQAMLQGLSEVEDPEARAVLSEIAVSRDMALGAKYTAWMESQQKDFQANRFLTISDFPAIYLEELERRLFPEWYTACFMRNCNSSVAWSHYADGHKGVCLIFEGTETTGESSIRLKQRNDTTPNEGELSWTSLQLPFYDVQYTEGPIDVDFFRSLGRMPVSKLLKHWYTDGEGNRSTCCSHFGTDEESWRKQYWDKFQRSIVSKGKEWTHEQESRLILSEFYGYGKKGNRTLSYDFRDLKGIIFGIHTSHDDKMRILQTIAQKCGKHNRSEFDILQAYYSHRTRDIQSTKLGVKFQL